MQRITLSFVLAAALFGCEKHDDTPTLHDNVIALGKFYEPILESLTKRGEDIVVRGGKLGGALPGGEQASRQLQMAGQQIAELRNVVSKGTDGKSALEKQADAAATEHKVDELAKLVDETNEKLEVGTRLITNELNIAENWLAQAEAAKAALAVATPVTPTEPMPAPIR